MTTRDIATTFPKTIKGAYQAMNEPVVVPLISIVVCTHNRAALLDRAIASLVTQETERFEYEILVVNNASTDQTQQVLQQWILRYPDLIRTFQEPRQGVAYARNRGVEESRGDWIAFFDDDQTAASNWLVTLFAFARERQSPLVGGSVRPVFPEGPYRQLGRFGRSAIIDTTKTKHIRRFNHRFSPVTANLLVNREVFERTGPFDPQFNDRGDDTMFFRRADQLGIHAWYSPDAVVYHHLGNERLTDESLIALVGKEMDGQVLLDQKRFGRLFPIILIARLIQGILGYLPRQILGFVLKDRDMVLEGKLRATFYLGTFLQGVAMLTPERLRRRLLSSWIPTPFKIDSNGHTSASIQPIKAS